MLRCPVCPERDSCKPPPSPTGPKPSRVMLIGEGPSRDEYRTGRVFAGKTGFEVDQQYLGMAGLTRDDVYLTNASKCAGRTKGGALDNPTVEQARACAEYFLPMELREVKPEVIVIMGAVAVKAVVGDIDLESRHGIPLPPHQMLSYFGTTGGRMIPTICTYHPAAGLHETHWMIPMQEDFRNLKRILRGESVWTPDQCLNPQYTEADSEEAIDGIFWPVRNTPGAFIGVDTEHDDGRPYSVQVSTTPGEGAFVPASRLDLIARLAYWLPRYVCVLHAAMADLPILDALGVPPRRWVDTMQQAYWLNEFRIGLKTLAFRHCGMEMRDYDEVVGPPSKRVLRDYMVEVAAAMSDAVPDTRKGKSLTTEESMVRHIRRNVRRLIGDIEKGVTAKGEPVKPWVRIDGWSVEDRGLIELFATKRAIPRPSIVHVERGEQVLYATADSDATLRLLPIVRQRALEIRRQVVHG